MTKPPTDREAVLQLARAARKRLHAIIGAVEDDDVDAAEVEKVVRGVHRVVFPVRRVGKLQRWLLLAREVEAAAAETPTASDADIARRAVAKYAITFPHVALDVAQVEAFVHAWRTDRNYFKALRAALVNHWPTVADERTMSKTWGKRRPPSSPSKDRPRRRPKKRSRLLK